MSSVESTTLYGGKPAPVWTDKDFSLPGYQNCRIIAKHITTNKEYQWGFLISPTGLSIQHNLDIQVNKTMAGFLISRNGSQLGSLNISGVFLDTRLTPERMLFWDFYTTYLCDKQNNYMEFISDYCLKIMIEGKYYWGVVQGINMSKNATQPLLYQYSMNFLFYKVTKAYSIPSGSMSKGSMESQMGLSKSAGQTLSPPPKGGMQFSKGISDILGGNF